MASDPSNPHYWEAPPNKVLAGPASGTDDGPIGARTLVAADLPSGASPANVSSAQSSATSGGLAASTAQSAGVSAGASASVARSSITSGTV